MSERDGQPPDDEQWREFQEFKRFQEFLRHSQATSDDSTANTAAGTPGTELQPWTPSPPVVPARPPASRAPAPQPAAQPSADRPHPDMHQQLAGMQRQLTELTEAQRAAERAANPPLWRRILRNKWLHRLAFLVLVLVIGGLVLNHYFGPPDEPPAQARQPGSKQERREIQGAAGPKQAVADVYRFTADASTARDPATATRVATLACNNFFTDAAAVGYARDRGAPDCVRAFQQVTVDSATEYGHPSLLALPPPKTDRYTVSSCAIRVSGGPLLGEFELRRQPHGTWVVTGHRNEPSPCPATRSGDDAG